MCSGRTGSGEGEGEGNGDASALLSCPACGRPISGLTSAGPHTGVVRPCGCTVAPGLHHREPDREPDAGADGESGRGADE
ncbi:hypothetical protein [Natrinema salaciae]|uniref:hypothetical protein n=1 Tax=Natrinema salaciae TaxID=1186196 RepID=UPI000B872F16|nr:hypothetical protein [Natrinema salaciae]